MDVILGFCCSEEADPRVCWVTGEGVCSGLVPRCSKPRPFCASSTVLHEKKWRWRYPTMLCSLSIGGRMWARQLGHKNICTLCYAHCCQNPNSRASDRSMRAYLMHVFLSSCVFVVVCTLACDCRVLYYKSVSINGEPKSCFAKYVPAFILVSDPLRMTADLSVFSCNRRDAFTCEAYASGALGNTSHHQHPHAGRPCPQNTGKPV